MPGGERQHDVAAPGLAGDDRCRVAGQAERPDERGEVVGAGVGVVAAVRGLRQAVAALVDGDDPVAGRGEVPGDAVPQPGVGGQAVHEQERTALAGQRADGEPRAAAGQGDEVVGRGQEGTTTSLGSRSDGRPPETVRDRVPTRSRPVP